MTVLISVVSYASLPDEVPTHFNHRSEADDYGNKQSIWLILGLDILIYSMLSWLSYKPQYMNYGLSTVKEENKEELYKIGSEMTQVINLILVFIFLFLVLNVSFYKKMLELNLHNVVFYLGTVLLVVVFYYLFKTLRVK